MIATVVTRGFGNGAVVGTIALVTTRGYSIGTGPPPAPPVADFGAAPLSGAPPLTVTFTDASTNTPTAWHWEKNDGSGWVDFAGSPTAANPIEVFTAGVWSVRLTATNAGGSATKTRTNYVTVVPIPPDGARVITVTLRDRSVVTVPLSAVG